MPHILEIAKMNGNDAEVGLIEETSKLVPEVDLVDARGIKGYMFKTLVRTKLGSPQGGSFRKANAGTAPIVHTYENRLFETYIMEPRIECDRAVADEHEDGPEAYMATQGEGVMQGEFQGLGQAFYYGRNGTLGNADAFPGLIDMYDVANMEVDAGGTTANTGSSVWLIRTGPRFLQWCWGRNRVLKLDPIELETIVDPNDATKKLRMYTQSGLARPGLALYNLRSVCRIKKLTADSGKGLTDSLIMDALAKFPAGLGPTLMLMTQRSAVQLAKSRTPTTPNMPVTNPAPVPTSYVGLDGSQIRIAITESISNAEPLTL